MKRNKIALAATSGLVGLSVLAGSMAYASTDSTAKDAEELAQFLSANPNVAAVVAGVETKTGGKVVGAEFDEKASGKGIVEFEVMMADGTEQDMLYTLADGSMTVEADEDDHDGDNDDNDDNDGDNDNDHDNDGDSDGENEADDDK